MKDITEDLSLLADVLAQQALSHACGLETKLEIFKLLTAYQFNRHNPNKPVKKEDDDGQDFASFRERVASTNGVGADDPSGGA